MDLTRTVAVFAAAIVVAFDTGAATLMTGGRVTIHRDDWGVPHIYAEEEALGYYGLGYAQAQDQLTKLLGGVYWLRGRQAELTGVAALPGDIEQRRWRHMDAARAGVKNLGPQVRHNYTSYIAGVERYLAEHPEKKPAWAPTLDLVDLVAMSRAALWAGYAAVEGPRECGIDPSTDTEQRASNGWVVAPQRSALGATMLLADPHVEFQNPLYYEYRIHAGALHSAGFALGPLLWQAHNRDVAWAMTTGNPDMWDCYAVEVNADDRTRYRYDGEDRQMVVVEETFAVAGGMPVKQVFEYTQHNGVLSPVVARRGSVAYAVSTSQASDAGILDGEIHRMNLATSTAQVRDALRSQGMFPQNLVIGDRAGSIFYVRSGKTPRRRAGYDYKSTLPGNTSKTAWLGYHPFEDLVQVTNPAQHYLQNNNVAPDRMFADGNLSASDYAEYLFNDTPGRITSRGVRALNVLSANTKLDVAAAKALAVDETWTTTTEWQNALRHAVRARPDLLRSGTDTFRTFVDRLLEFDGVASAASIPALSFYYWRRGMWDVFAREELARLRHFPWHEGVFSAAFDEALLQRAARAAEEMQQELGSIDVPLGAVFRVGRSLRSWPIGGESIDITQIPNCVADASPLCERTMRAFVSAAPDAQKERRAFRGSQAVRLVVFTDPLQSFSLHVYGQSDDETSPHFDDQARLLSERQLKPEYFEPADLRDHIESTLVLEVQRTESGDWR